MSFISQLGWHDGSLRSGGVYERAENEPTTAQLRAFIENETRTSDEVLARQKNATDFVLNHPEFINDDANAALMRHELEITGHWPNPSLNDFEEAYVSLSGSRLLKLDQKKINAQRAQELDKRAAEIKANRFDEDAAYAMPLEELEARGRGWM